MHRTLQWGPYGDEVAMGWGESAFPPRSSSVQPLRPIIGIRSGLGFVSHNHSTLQRIVICRVAEGSPYVNSAYYLRTRLPNVSCVKPAVQGSVRQPGIHQWVWYQCGQKGKPAGAMIRKPQKEYRGNRSLNKTARHCQGANCKSVVRQKAKR